jgi:hypothetical protein
MSDENCGVVTSGLLLDIREVISPSVGLVSKAIKCFILL